MGSINFRKPSISSEHKFYPDSGNHGFALIVDDREFALSAHTTWEDGRKNQLMVSCFAENGRSAPGVYLSPEAATALRDGLNEYLAFHEENHNLTVADTVTGDLEQWQPDRK